MDWEYSECVKATFYVCISRSVSDSWKRLHDFMDWRNFHVLPCEFNKMFFYFLFSGCKRSHSVHRARHTTIRTHTHTHTHATDELNIERWSIVVVDSFFFWCIQWTPDMQAQKHTHARTATITYSTESYESCVCELSASRKWTSRHLPSLFLI